MNSNNRVALLPPVLGSFVHGVDLDDFYPCWNLALSGLLSSPDFAAISDPNLAVSHRLIRDTPIEELRARGLPGGIPTPRAVWCIGAAAVARAGGRVGVGEENTQWYSPEAASKLSASGDMELAFEAGRRQFAKGAPSRLSALYLADDSDAGRAHVVRMLGPKIHILRVVVPWATRVARVDTAWFDEYCRNPNPQFIENYWRALPKNPNAPNWEILVDGAIRVDDPTALEYLKLHGAHLEFDRGGLFNKENRDPS